MLLDNIISCIKYKPPTPEDLRLCGFYAPCGSKPGTFNQRIHGEPKRWRPAPVPSNPGEARPERSVVIPALPGREPPLSSSGSPERANYRRFNRLKSIGAVMNELKEQQPNSYKPSDAKNFLCPLRFYPNANRILPNEPTEPKLQASCKTRTDEQKKSRRLGLRL